MWRCGQNYCTHRLTVMRSSLLAPLPKPEEQEEEPCHWRTEFRNMLARAGALEELPDRSCSCERTQPRTPDPLLCMAVKMTIPQCTHPFCYWWISELFPDFCPINNVAKIFLDLLLGEHMCAFLLGIHTGVELLGRGIYESSAWISKLFPSACINWHSH